GSIRRGIGLCLSTPILSPARRTRFLWFHATTTWVDMSAWCGEPPKYTLQGLHGSVQILCTCTRKKHFIQNQLQFLKKYTIYSHEKYILFYHSLIIRLQHHFMYKR